MQFEDLLTGEKTDNFIYFGQKFHFRYPYFNHTLPSEYDSRVKAMKVDEKSSSTL